VEDDFNVYESPRCCCIKKPPGRFTSSMIFPFKFKQKSWRRDFREVHLGSSAFILPGSNKVFKLSAYSVSITFVFIALPTCPFVFFPFIEKFPIAKRYKTLFISIRFETDDLLQRSRFDCLLLFHSCSHSHSLSFAKRLRRTKELQPCVNVMRSFSLASIKIKRFPLTFRAHTRKKFSLQRQVM
jgi:hypothetical protein